MKKIISVLVSLLLAFSIFFTASCTLNVEPPLGDSVTNGENEEEQPDNENENSGNSDEKNDDNTEDDGEGNNATDNPDEEIQLEVPAITRPLFDPTKIPAYNNTKISIELNNNVPYFTEEQITDSAYEYYSPLDSLGRCQIAVACLGRELMPTTGRGSIGSISPSGWHGNSIYERSHLIAFALAGEDANRMNLITGTYDLNSEMQRFETMVLDYIKETGNHVMYRVEPIFTQNNLVAIGVIMEAYSVEDHGDGISFNVFIYNGQDDIIIDYATGDYYEPASAYTYILNKSNNKIHKTTCTSVHNMSESNKVGTTLTLEELVAQLTKEGKTWSYCGTCKPQNG